MAASSPPDPVRWSEVNRLFEAAIARPPGERLAFVAAQCGSDSSLRADVESLLAAHRDEHTGLRQGVIVGSRLGDYEVTGFIAAGGMGEVYRAHDVKLGRDVALKILPAALVADADRRARFEREARLLASLNHPNIATIYGFVEQAGTSALVLELVEGETLADRIAHGKVPLEEALRIARQIAEALEAAHEQGIIHRDLKPANIKVTADGVVKVLDFGLAKLAQGSGLTAQGTGAAATISPTVTSPAMMTGAGVLLGTAAYMSPEQAKGREADKRSDVWAFGCVLYEMLTGKRAFDGEDVVDVLSRVLQRDPEWAALPANVPAAIRALLRRCLQKNRRQRIADISTALFVLEEQAGLAPQAGTESVTAPPRGPLWRRVVPLAAAAVVTGIAAGLATWAVTRPASPRPVHLTMSHPAPEVVGGSNTDGNLALSPDGRSIAYVASASPEIGDSTLPLYLRSLDASEPRLLSSSARAPFFSPDSQWVGFVEGNSRLSKVAVTGGPSVSIGNVDNGFRGGSWGPDDAIVFATNDLSRGLSRISAAGGNVEALTTPDAAKGEVDHLFPEVLPGGRAVLFTILTNQGADKSQIAVLDLAARTYRVVIQGGAYAHYSASGHLVYGVNGTLRAVGFDLARLEVRGTPVPVLDGVQTKLTGAAIFGLSPDGTLVYLTGGADRPSRTLEWIDRMGGEESLGVEPPPGLSHRFDDPVLSPDGTQVAVTLGQDTADGDVWIWSLARRTLTRLTFEPGLQAYPRWTRDGRKVAYGSLQSGVFWRNADGTGTAEAVGTTEAKTLEGLPGNRTSLIVIRPWDWSVDGRLLFSDPRSQTVGMTPSQQGERTPTTLLKSTDRTDLRPSLSPDGRWLAYLSGESGRPEVYVRPFPAVDTGKWQVSTEGAGQTPRWGSNGRSLFFKGAAGLMEVAIETSPTFKASAPHRVLTWPEGVTSDFDVSRDGTRFLVVKDVGDTARGQLNVVLNWQEELKRLVPTN